ncbi:LacI family DNA-binding transcriptional regulator [Arthrobacter sp. NtRootA1]|uniref:LacI family DNA-binding transcriptional regulator n=1 Tax=Arthrobacter sp. NtRootA1 TaxID=2830983 RepID=UPI001CC45182|nr:LacI family DNA-binding transcriptional regulator [Arthrobacter sp. NtRootA1]BCW05926.1 LacI family transcriptional regulator [Arthrobacter sp. NtRootA1]
MPATKRVTLFDVAKHAGVSRASASLVVRGTGRLSPETRERVLAAMGELGYVYHRGAASLRTQRSSSVGVLITDIANPSFANLTQGLEQGLASAGYFTMLSNTFDDQDRELQLVRSFLEYPVDALVYVPAAGELAETRRLLASAPIPVLAVTRTPSESGAYVGPDNFLGGWKAAEHMIVQHGCTKLAFLGGPSEGPARRDRLDGVRARIEETTGVSLVFDLHGPVTPDSAEQMSAAAIATQTEFDGLICHSDLVAYAFLSAWRKTGKEPLPVIGFDDLPISKLFDPPVTSITVGQLGARAAERVLQMIDGGEPFAELMPPHIELRESCGCHAANGG